MLYVLTALANTTRDAILDALIIAIGAEILRIIPAQSVELNFFGMRSGLATFTPRLTTLYDSQKAVNMLLTIFNGCIGCATSIKGTTEALASPHVLIAPWFAFAALLNLRVQNLQKNSLIYSLISKNIALKPLIWRAT
jgi:hypothetical protein